MTSDNTRRAYAQDWQHYSRWCRLRGDDPLPPRPETIALYLADLARPQDTSAGLSLASIERRLSGLSWNAQQRGFDLDRRDPTLAAALTDIRHRLNRPATTKDPLSARDILAMISTLPRDLRGMRDRTILLMGYAGGLRRSEIVGLDARRDAPYGGQGWVTLTEPGALLVLRAGDGWREVEIGRGSSDRGCPVHALEQWLSYAKIDQGPIFVRVSRDAKRILGGRLNDRHVARLVKQTVHDAGIRGELPEKDRMALFSGHSLRAGFAHHAEAAEHLVRAQLGIGSPPPRAEPEMRFQVNLTRAAGL
ncbi:site-specific tyrosine recombinase XerC (plasmid) [Paracoccaceae bacterium]|nr:site-specific tyrosine recombinase XerC [Paracoccaceae bacterium]